jgi:hypothetical protein
MTSASLPEKRGYTDVGRQMMDPFGFAFSFSTGCTRLQPDDFMGYFKRTFAYIALMENSSLMDRIRDLAKQKKEEDEENKDATYILCFESDGALDILTGIVKMIYNLRTLRQLSLPRRIYSIMCV